MKSDIEIARRAEWPPGRAATRKFGVPDAVLHRYVHVPASGDLP